MTTRQQPSDPAPDEQMRQAAREALAAIARLHVEATALLREPAPPQPRTAPAAESADPG